MRKFTKVTVGLMSAFFISLSGIQIANAKSNTKGVNGSVVVNFRMEKDTVEKSKKWYDNCLKAAKKATTDEINKTDKTEIEKQDLRQTLVKLDNISADKSFIKNEDESASLETPLPFAELKIGDVTTKLDKKGGFVLDKKLPAGKYPIVLSLNGKKIYNTSIDIKDNQSTLDIEINVNNKDVSAAVKKMQNEMNSTTQAAASAMTNKFYSTYSVGDTVGSGHGQMLIVSNDTNAVECNKADTDLDNDSDFPDNNSDCAISIGLGEMYASNASAYSSYWRSDYCYIEAFQAGMRTLGADDATSNIYCDGTYKASDGHYNCSWFYGIDHPDELHTHY